MGRKHLALAVVLGLVIVVAVVLVVKGVTGVSKPPAAVLEKMAQKLDKIDAKSMEIVTARPDEWTGKYAPDASGLYKNPKTGEYTAVEILMCVACNQPIPAPDRPPELQPKPAATAPDQPPPPAHVQAQLREAIEKWQLACKCPKCAKCPFPDNRPAPPPR